MHFTLEMCESHAPLRLSCTGVLLISFYSITAPIGIAIGIGIASSYNSKSVARNATEVSCLLLIVLLHVHVHSHSTYLMIKGRNV